MMQKPARISIIIPTLNEEARLAETLAPMRTEACLEIIVADGGSRDLTQKIAVDHGCRVVIAAPNRATQMNLGAAAATGDILLFLHADTRLPAGFGSAIRHCLAATGVSAGAFRLTIDAPGAAIRLIERLANWRADRRQTPYGDQAIFLRADLFQQLGGYADVPLLEDLILVKRLAALGRIAILPDMATTSGRRFASNGPLRTSLINQLILLGFRCGVSPSRLALLYRRLRRG